MLVIEILTSPYVIAFASAWVVAHLIKFVISLINKENINLGSHLYRSGGMPSAHSATSVAVATMIGLSDGFSSGLFGLAVLVSTVFLYDSMMVRRSCGEQGQAVEQIIKDTKSKVKLRHIALGHKPVEVLVGSILGILISVIVFFATR